MDKTFYQEEGMLSKFKGWIWGNQNGPLIQDNDELVSISLLNTICLKIVEQMKSKRNELIEECEFRIQFRELKSDDFDLIIIHLTTKYSVDYFEDKNKQRVFKFYDSIEEKISE
jgi:hypothetical protein